jgi:hypothetical protein
VCKLLEFVAADGAAHSRHGVSQIHFPMDVASPNGDCMEALRSCGSDVVVEGELANALSLGHPEHDTLI